MRFLGVVLLLAFVAMANSSLLEMSQSLWTKVLEGGLAKIGALDPLRVPIVKVDQSEGNTSYRMILRSLEITGLNSSTLESVHIGRGGLKTHLNEHEAGYVSYTDQKELDMIRYRFHTVVKEPRGGEASQDLRVKPIAELENSRNTQNQNGRVRNYDRTSFEASSRYQDSQQRATPQGQRAGYESSSRYQENQQRTAPQSQRSNYEFSSRYENSQQRADTRPQESRLNYQSSSRYPDQNNRRVSGGPRGSNYEAPMTPEDQRRYYSESHQNSRRPSEDLKASEYQTPERQQQESSIYSSSRSSSAGDQQNAKFSARAQDAPGNIRVVYAERLRTPEDDSESKNQRTVNYRAGPISGCMGNCEYRRQQGHRGVGDQQGENMKTDRREDEIGVAASMNFESRRAYADVRVAPARNQEDSVKGRVRLNNGPENENRYAANYDKKSNERDNERKYEEYMEGPSARLENQPGYVDIVYADEKDHKMRHFGNLRVEPGQDKTVYGLEDVLRDLRDHRRFIIHNFTEGEALMKKNDAVRTATETKRIKDMLRYAKEFQEKQGYYEQGMKLIYHYGDREDDEQSKDNQTRRNKRAHLDDETEEDVMHVIMRIRVPMLQVNAGYVLMGKVGKQVLRGNGLLAGNFTELIGDFTVELKKVDEDTMIVRAARARLSAKDKNIKLQGMDEEGPVKEILTHGLMAAEAVAAMLADDLTTKALSEKTADSIIYKMYKNLPVEKS